MRSLRWDWVCGHCHPGTEVAKSKKGILSLEGGRVWKAHKWGTVGEGIVRWVESWMPSWAKQGLELCPEVLGVCPGGGQHRHHQCVSCPGTEGNRGPFPVGFNTKSTYTKVLSFEGASSATLYKKCITVLLLSK